MNNTKSIVKVEEFEQVQKIMAEKSNKLRKNGLKPPVTVWGRIMECKCGNRFNVKYYQRKYRTPGRDFQCYTSVNLGSMEEHRRRGLTTDGLCETPFISGWKMDLMAYHIFNNYISNADETVNIACEILKRHLADREEFPDHSKEIQEKQEEMEKLKRKITHLIEMREDGDIDREYFHKRKTEIKTKLSILENSITDLYQTPVSTIKEDFELRLEDLKEKMQSYTSFDTQIIPDNMIEAFIEKIWVSKDEFRWYLRTDKRKSDEDIEYIKIASFTLTLEDAKKYIYSFSNRRRTLSWFDLNVSVWI